MYGGLKNTPKDGEQNSKIKKKKTVKYKINRKIAESVGPNGTGKKPSSRETFKTSVPVSSKATTKKESQPVQQKRNPLNAVGKTKTPDPCPSLTRAEIKEDEEHHEEKHVDNPLLCMTKQQISAFRDIFDMFDSNGGGTIRSEDLDQALRSVNISLTKEEVNELFYGMDLDGNGGVDFDEFVRLVANTEKFLESTIVSRGKLEAESEAGIKPMQNILFKALAQFMKSSALSSVNEIVRYYHANAERYSNPHYLIGHYTAGARLIGLTERQLRREMKKLTKISSDNKSPYAQPLVTSLDTFFEEKTKTKKLRIKQKKAKEKASLVPTDLNHDRHERGKIRLKFMACIAPTKPNNRRDSLYLQFLTMQNHIRKQKCIRRGTISKEVRTLGYTCPGVKLPQFTNIPEMDSKVDGQRSKIKENLAQDLTIDDLKLIRKQFSNITKNFYKRVQREKLRTADKHWQDLGTDEIKSQSLRKSFQESFLAYTDYRKLPLSSIASSYARTNPLYVRL